MSDEELYERWLYELCIGEPERDRHPETEEEAPYWLEALFPNEKTQDTEITRLFQRTMEQSGTDLVRFTPRQAADGLERLLLSPHSVPYSLRSPRVPQDLRRSALLSLKTLYRDYFSPNLSSVVSDETEHPLWYVCFMLWDASPLNYHGSQDDDFPNDFVCLEVMEYALTLPNLVCVQSALHGLGHMIIYEQYKKRVEHAIDAFLQANPALPPSLADYAQQARLGIVM